MSTILWIVGGLVATQIPKILRAGNITNNLVPEVRDIKANIRFVPFPVLNVFATMGLKNFSGVGLKVNNLFLRVQYENPDKTWSDLATSNEVLPVVDLIANKTTTKDFGLSAPMLNFLQIKSTTPLKLVVAFEVAGIPKTVTLKEFTIGQYIPGGVFDQIKNFKKPAQNPLPFNFINGL